MNSQKRHEKEIKSSPFLCHGTYIKSKNDVHKNICLWKSAKRGFGLV